jgi:hypothetical protein
MSDAKEPKIARKGVLIALGIICIILVACLLGVVAAYTVMINDKSNTISSLNYQISQLNSTVANLQQQVASLKSLVAVVNQLTDTVEGVNESLGLQLTMTLQKINYSLGEPVNMTFTVTNISNHTIYLSHYFAGAFNMFEFRVYNDTDNSLWSMIYSAPGFNPGGPVVTVTILNPGEWVTGVWPWEQMCNNTVPVPVSPGTYYIVGQIGPLFLDGTVETTPIQITIA